MYQTVKINHWKKIDISNTIYKVVDPKVKCPVEVCPSMFLESRFPKSHGKHSHKNLSQELFNIEIKRTCPFCHLKYAKLANHKLYCPAKGNIKVACQYCGEEMSKEGLKYKHLKTGRCPKKKQETEQTIDEDATIISSCNSSSETNKLCCQHCQQPCYRKDNLI